MYIEGNFKNLFIDTKNAKAKPCTLKLWNLMQKMCMIENSVWQEVPVLEEVDG